MPPTDPGITRDLHVADGDGLRRRRRAGAVTGPARVVLQGERVALNLVQRMSGIATLTARYVAEAAAAPAPASSTRARPRRDCARLSGTRCACGGGHNHRYSLSDAVMAKDNHLAVLTRRAVSVTDALRAVRAQLLAHDALRGRGRPPRPDRAGARRRRRHDHARQLHARRAPRGRRAGRRPGARRGQRQRQPGRPSRAIAETGVDVISVGRAHPQRPVARPRTGRRRRGCGRP